LFFSIQPPFGRSKACRPALLNETFDYAGAGSADFPLPVRRWTELQLFDETTLDEDGTK